MAQVQSRELFKLEIDDKALDLSFDSEEDSIGFSQVEFELVSPVDYSDPRQVKIYEKIDALDEKIASIEARVGELNSEIDRLTNHADALDYAVAVASGILTGLIDSFFVGDFNPSLDDVITKFAKQAGCKDGQNPQEFLEKKYHTKNDNAYMKKGNKMGVGGRTHRLDDISHHPTLMGLIASIMVCFFGRGMFVNNNGEVHFPKMDTKPGELVKAWAPAVLAGVLIWLTNVAEDYVEENMDVKIPEPIRKIVKLLAASPLLIKIFKCAEQWYGHIMSDVGTSEGIPGLFLSFLKEISMLPGLSNTELPKLVQDLYMDKKLSFASDVVMFEKLKKQAVPVLINEMIVRSFYFVRRLINELKTKGALENVDWKKTMPFKNRTIARMLTIATGTFTAFDLADAVIRSGGINPNTILRVNFVGLGRFAIAICTDIGMGIKKGKLERERIKLNNEQLHLLNAKLFYKQADMWIAVEETERAINEVYVIMDTAALEFLNTWTEIKEGSARRQRYAESIRTNDKEFADELLTLLE